jgi:EF hand
MYRSFVALVGMSLMIGSASTSAFAVSKRTAAAASADVRALVRMMDKDQNGVVSKQEFMDFMSQTFDALDINASGQLEPSEVRALTSSRWLNCESLAMQRGIVVTERGRETTGTTSPWKQFMNSCLAGKVSR